jgi:hypothetical protein
MCEAKRTPTRGPRVYRRTYAYACTTPAHRSNCSPVQCNASGLSRMNYFRYCGVMNEKCANDRGVLVAPALGMCSRLHRRRRWAALLGNRHRYSVWAASHGRNFSALVFRSEVKGAPVQKRKPNGPTNAPRPNK